MAFQPGDGFALLAGQGTALDFDPLRDVRTHADLRRFPNLVNELRELPLEALVPRGYGEQLDVVGAFDSGGTTGTPKRVLLLSDWMRSSLTWKAGGWTSWDFPAASTGRPLPRADRTSSAG
ncbi:hypothetical protein [Amycolatopsis sp. NPDC051061]|uniref:hypothetical protein n=1 Tax=Amycolatopsis sp. NPDC051061 TaxID=3155042 RepID=UPI00341E4002